MLGVEDRLSVIWEKGVVGWPWFLEVASTVFNGILKSATSNNPVFFCQAFWQDGPVSICRCHKLRGGKNFQRLSTEG